MRTCLCLILCIFLCVNISAAQTCLPSSIPASTPDSQLTDNGDGTISDSKTGLMWKKCVEGISGSDCASGVAAAFNWQQALERPGTVNSGEGFAGYTDWRLPNIKELTSIVEWQCFDPAINLNRFPNSQSSYVWSGSLGAYYSYGAWYVYFYNGYSYYGYYRKYYYLHVRLVRWTSLSRQNR